GGPAWTWDARRGQYYLHNFLPEQPDLNLHNPKVQDAVLGVARFWLDRGVDGFRLDAINFAMHDPDLRDNPPAPAGGKRTRSFDFQQHIYNQSHPDIVGFLERLREVVDSYGDRFTLAEVGGDHALGEMQVFTEGQRRLNSAYGFDFLYAEKLTGACRTGCQGLARECWLAHLGLRESRRAAGHFPLVEWSAFRAAGAGEDAAALHPARLDHPLPGRGACASPSGGPLRQAAGPRGDRELAAHPEPGRSEDAHGLECRGAEPGLLYGRTVA